ncbi:MAG: DUF2490 domain-containing protein [Bacteroidales bacterium]|nr:DUF2490 domain-containing protein [Bacteroidales bacterium]
MIRTLIIAVLIALSSVAYSQVNDAGLWTDISIEKRFNQAFSVEFANCERFDENITELGSIVNEIGLNYSFTPRDDVSVFYRIKLNHALDNTYYPIRRFYLDYSHEFELAKFDLDARLRAQTQQKNTYFFDFDSSSKFTLRPKIKLSYQHLKWEPYLSFEAYLPFFEDDYKPCEKFRAVIGLEYSLNKHNAFDLGYMIQKEVFKKNPLTDFVLLVGYKFKF